MTADEMDEREGEERRLMDEEKMRDEIKALRAVICEVHSWAVCFAIAPAEDMAQNFPRIVEITSPEYVSKGE
jgi:hypothetical protein